MAYARHDLGLVSRLSASAIGAPGQRRFRIQAECTGSTACLWVEKEQLFHLAMAVQQMQTNLPEETPGAPNPPEPQGDTAPVSLEFKVGKLALGHDPERRLFLLLAHSPEDAKDETATVSLWATRQQVASLAEEALTVCAAGRPLCPLCGVPMGPGPHICPRSNGHAVLEPR